MHWNWDHLRFFLALADKGTLALAARELDVSHSTVLRRIKSFEKELETHLFDHTPNGHHLTPAGEALYVEAQKMRATVADISRDIAGSDQALKGEVVITTTDTLGFFVLPRILSECQTRYPDIRLTLNVSNDRTDLSNREADIAVRTGGDPPPHLLGSRLGMLRFAACASIEYCRHHALTRFPAEATGHHFIELNQQYRGTPFHEWLQARIPDDACVTTVNGFISAVALCCSGMGITLLPDYVIEHEPRLQRLSEGTVPADNELWLLSHADTRESARMRVVRQFLTQALRRQFERGN